MVRKDPEQLLDLWLAERYGWCPDVTVARRFQQLLEQATEVLYRAIYVRDHVFHRHSQLPESYGQAVWSLYSQLARNHWLPGSAQISTSRVTIRKYRWKTSRELRKRRMR